MSVEQIDTIQRWAGSGALPGNPADLPPPPSFPADWQIGQPDLVLSMPRAYHHPSGTHDVFRNVVLRIQAGGPRFVRAVELRPGSAPIYHAIIRIDRTPESRSRNGSHGQPGFDGMAALNVQNPAGHFIGGRLAADRLWRPKGCRGGSIPTATW